jgi:dipeptidyl aminopeptidase/acylaminoacyl peptidase
MSSAPARALAELGFITLMLDSRGTPVGSRAFHQGGYPALLEPQVADHAAVVRQLCEQFQFVDGHRVGLLGFSAGGAAAVRALCNHPDIFKVGVAACAYDDADLCTSMWSDQYRGPQGAVTRTEQANSELVPKLRGNLLLMSGDLDENVSVSQTLGLVDALIRANKDFDLLIVPNATHGFLFENGYAQRRMWDYFVRHLLGEMPPSDCEIRFEPAELAEFARKSRLETRP